MPKKIKCSMTFREENNKFTCGHRPRLLRNCCILSKILYPLKYTDPEDGENIPKTKQFYRILILPYKNMENCITLHIM